MFLKGLIAAALESSEPLLFLRLNGRVGAILHRESTDSLIYIPYKPPSGYSTPLTRSPLQTLQGRPDATVLHACTFSTS